MLVGSISSNPINSDYEAFRNGKSFLRLENILSNLRKNYLNKKTYTIENFDAIIGDVFSLFNSLSILLKSCDDQRMVYFDLIS
jgi:hypothetical protein